MGTPRVCRPADYLPPGTVGQWPPATGQWWNERRGGDPRTDQVAKGPTRTPGWHPEETASLTANACRPEAVGWAPLVCAGPLTTSLRGLWVSGLLPPGGSQPGPLAFSCMTVALVMYEHPDEALVLIHSHANSEKARACINNVNYNTVLQGFTMGKRAKEVFSTFEVLK